MKYAFEPLPATFVERPNRFLVLARLPGGEVVRAHCPDPGRLRELLIPGATLFLSRAAESRGRTTAYDLRLVRHPENGTLVSLDSRLPNTLFREALLEGRLEPFGAPSRVRAEASLPIARGTIRSRADYLLEYEAAGPCWVEVKSATLVVDGVAMFPDAVTDRGRRHVEALATMARLGYRTAVCFIIQRPDAQALRPEWERDPAFAAALARARSAGVELYAWTCTITLEEARLHRPVPVLTERP